MVNGSRRWSARISFLKNLFAAETSRFALTENGQTTYYLRSSALGGRVVAELSGSGVWQRGHVYLGEALLAVQAGGAVRWQHENPVTKAKMEADAAGGVSSATVVDPWGGEVAASFQQNTAQQRHKFTTYERDAHARDDATHRQYSGWYARFSQPDPWGGSYHLSNPQSLNRYAYVQGDPVNFVDPTGLNLAAAGTITPGSGYCWFVSWVPADGGKPNLVGGHCTPDHGGGGTHPGGGPEPPPREPVQDKKSDCGRTVDDLVRRTDKTENAKFAIANVGRVMGFMAKNELSRGSKDIPHEGFRWELVNNGQRGDVHKHVYGHAGATLVGNAKIYGWGGGRTGNQISEDELNIDRGQLNDPDRKLQAETEIRGSLAGREVGNLMRSRIQGRISADQLRNALFNLLCEY